MEGLCLVGVFLIFIFAWIYEKVTNGKNISTPHYSSSGYRSSNVTSSKRGRCRYCGREVIVDELPDSISRDAFEQFGLCLNSQWGIFMQNGGHF
jgi:hypothetical protein